MEVPYALCVSPDTVIMLGMNPHYEWINIIFMR